MAALAVSSSTAAQGSDGSTASGSDIVMILRLPRSTTIRPGLPHAGTRNICRRYRPARGFVRRPALPDCEATVTRGCGDRAARSRWKTIRGLADARRSGNYPRFPGRRRESTVRRRHRLDLHRDEGGRGSAAPAAGLITAGLVGSERVRRHPHRRARSAPQCGVSRGPRACRVRVPIPDGRRPCATRRPLIPTPRLRRSWRTPPAVPDDASRGAGRSRRCRAASGRILPQSPG